MSPAPLTTSVAPTTRTKRRDSTSFTASGTTDTAPRSAAEQEVYQAEAMIDTAKIAGTAGSGSLAARRYSAAMTSAATTASTILHRMTMTSEARPRAGSAARASFSTSGQAPVGDHRQDGTDGEEEGEVGELAERQATRPRPPARERRARRRRPGLRSAPRTVGPPALPATRPANAATEAAGTDVGSRRWHIASPPVAGSRFRRRRE